MKFEVHADADEAARRAAVFIAAEARAAAAARGLFTLAVSGGTSPWKMLGSLLREDVPWAQVELFQVDERIAPAGDPDRNLTHLEECLLSKAPLDPQRIHAMPVEQDDSEDAARKYAETLARVAGDPAMLDLVHLGLGPDGHTASLVPGDPVLDVRDRNVALAGPYQDRMRMTLTYPVLDRARRVLWLTTGTAPSCVGSAVEVLFSIVILVGGKCMRIGKSVGLSVLTHSWSASSAIAER